MSQEDLIEWNEQMNRRARQAYWSGLRLRMVIYAFIGLVIWLAKR